MSLVEPGLESSAKESSFQCTPVSNTTKRSHKDHREKWMDYLPALFKQTLAISHVGRPLTVCLHTSPRFMWSSYQRQREDVSGLYLAISSDSKQSLFPADHLDRPQSSQRLTTHWKLHLGTVNTTQLSSMVVTPHPDLTSTSTGQYPVIWRSETIAHITRQSLHRIVFIIEILCMFQRENKYLQTAAAVFIIINTSRDLDRSPRYIQYLDANISKTIEDRGSVPVGHNRK